MRKKQVTVEVNQSIIYTDTEQQDRWHFRAVGDLLELETFSKLSYENEQGQPTAVKWQNGPKTNQWIVEIKQGENLLRFNPNQVTSVHYQTAQGMLSMLLATQSIRWGFEPTATGQMRRHLTIDYQLMMDEAPIGDYRYTLTYTE